MQNKNLKTFLQSLGDKSFDALKDNCEFTLKENGNLYMLSFNNKNDLNDDLVREANGIILEKDTNKLVHYSFSKIFDGLTEDYNRQNPLDTKDTYSKTLENYRVELLIEGSLIKVFNYENEWKIATSRSIDAVYSYWGSDKSFKQLFLETIDFSLDTLDKDYCYSFILQHPEVTIGYDITVADVIPLNKVNLQTLETISLMDGYTVDVKKEEFNEKVNFSKNFIVITEDNQRIKVLSKEYTKVQDLLGNNSSIIWAYLEALQEGEELVFRDFFKSKTETFDFVDYSVNTTVEYLHDIYFKKFVAKETITYDKRYAKPLYELHKKFKETGEKTTKTTVFNYILDLDVKTLYKLLNL